MLGARVHIHLMSTSMGKGSSRAWWARPRNRLSEQLISRWLGSLGAANAGAIPPPLFLSVFFPSQLKRKNERTKNLLWLFPSSENWTTTRWFAPTKCVICGKRYTQGALSCRANAAIPATQLRSSGLAFIAVRTTLMYMYYTYLLQSC